MNKNEFWVDQLNRAYNNDPWHGPSTLDVLRDIPPEMALRKEGKAHSIWEVFLHIIAWEEEVFSRLNGGGAQTPAAGDWPPVEATTAEYWDQCLQRYSRAHNAVVELVRNLPAEKFGLDIGKERNRELGTGVTYEGLISGLVQHNAYHSGQISILKSEFSI